MIIGFACIQHIYLYWNETKASKCSRVGKFAVSGKRVIDSRFSKSKYGISETWLHPGANKRKLINFPLRFVKLLFEFIQ